MQTSTTEQGSASAIGLQTRFNTVRSFLIDRGVRNYISVFQAFGMDVDTRKEDISAWWNSRIRMKPEDESLLSEMERVVEILKNEQAA